MKQYEAALSQIRTVRRRLEQVAPLDVELYDTVERTLRHARRWMYGDVPSNNA